ncbi:hypothetical protein GCM10023069_08260 [Shinella granuli]|uniref:Uncharacterized protein n=1 Tax=Shinella granuli TaxID=323621 RepID=A0A4R2C8C8_SHIGR|nr:hypothetical protein [Shinella granuli]TCN35632.1 hypothetical protein EV665_1277 [Shinella granuli]
MDHDLIGLHKYNPVLGPLVGLGYMVQFPEVEWNLMICRARAGEGYSLPGARHRPMYVTEEKMLDPRIAANNTGDVRLVVLADAVEAGDTAIKRRMVHEEIDIPVAGMLKLPYQPRLPFFAITPAIRAFFHGVHQDEAADRRIECGLNKAVFITWRDRNPLPQEGSAVMISDHEVDRHGQRGHDLPKKIIGRRLGFMRQIAQYDAGERICVVLHDISDAGTQARLRIQPVKHLTARYEVRVANADELVSS